MFESVLLTLDGSLLAAAAMEPVEELAKALGSQVRLLTVLTPEVEGHFSEFAQAERLKPAQAVESYLAGRAADLEEAGIAAKVDVVAAGRRSPAEVILDYVDTNGISMIAMSTHGRSGVARWLLGSVAEKVSRASPVPVVLVRPPEARRD